MATEKAYGDLTLLSSGDMSSHQFRGVKASTTNAVDGAILATARGQAITGVWQNNSTQSEAGRLITFGVSKMQAGDSSAMENAITVGAHVAISSVGNAVPSTDTSDATIGIALDGLSTGSTGIIRVLVVPGASSTD